MVSRSPLLQIYLRSIPIPTPHLCVLRSIQPSSQTPSSSWIHQETNLRRFSSFRRPLEEFSPNKSNKDLRNVFPRYPDNFIYKPLRGYDENRTIFVGGLSKYSTAKSLYNHFLPFGTITGCSLAQNIKTGLSKNFGFVEFESILEKNSNSHW
ncbi:RNA recognition motif domain-containing protein [Ditylenchus destructor]|uniref:RNA recognition motif domain-containing protein n=1 Tax=Ditylenchus destructor TaxID=166010 RepID=A0AAD4MVX7_9BILA|nr:RNA recognition motif domain-containing protein [Ditylenchus destructor]